MASRNTAIVPPPLQNVTLHAGMKVVKTHKFFLAMAGGDAPIINRRW